MIVRDATHADAAAVANLANGLARVTGLGPGAMTADNVTRDLIGARDMTLIVGEIEGRVVGYALYHVAYETAHAARGLYLSDVFVEENARRSGIARRMMGELARRCRDDGGSFIWWIVIPGNPAADSFYASLGAYFDPVRAMSITKGAFRDLLEA